MFFTLLRARKFSVTACWYAVIFFLCSGLEQSPMHHTLLFELHHWRMGKAPSYTKLVSIKLHCLRGHRSSLSFKRDLWENPVLLGHHSCADRSSFMVKCPVLQRRDKLFFLLTLRNIFVFPACQLSSLPSTASEILTQHCRASFFTWCAKASLC